ncbi:MAG TPA: hypothetical protein VFX92_13255 [Candidatus Krumholzibacteria bacterium]|nr:hypothetical protein [Candidatus Krumholzibacteria bacterium]
MLLMPIQSWSADQSGIKARTIEIRGAGTWAGDPTKTLALRPDLTLGANDDDTSDFFARPADIVADAHFNFFVLDNGLYCVKQFDPNGRQIRTIGRRGPGPGELEYPTAIALDDIGRVYVADGLFVEVFDSTGIFLDQWHIASSDGFIHSLEIDPTTRWTYATCLDILEQTIIHVSGPDHENIFSFCDSWGKSRDIDLLAEGAFGGGKIDLADDGSVYFTQLTPYEIRKFSAAGDLLWTVRRMDSPVTRPEIWSTPTGVSMRAAALSSDIVALKNGRFLNVAKRLPDKDEEPLTVLDLYDVNGELLLTQSWARDFDVKTRDSRDRLYLIELDEYPAITRNQLILTTDPMPGSQPRGEYERFPQKEEGGAPLRPLHPGRY